ncbi:MAG: hypothetical protein C0429_06810 [Sphingopyxis sp.]|nr:hypothetical protein [Sphingopyxis sp.]
MTDEDCASLRELALAMPSDEVPADPAFIARKLEYVAATLPFKNVDQRAGQKRMAVYIRILSGYSEEAVSFMAINACKLHDWFPTPRQCIEILESYVPPQSKRDDILKICAAHVENSFDAFKKSLATGTVEPAAINSRPQRWLRILVEQGLLRFENDQFVQRRRPEHVPE